MAGIIVSAELASCSEDELGDLCAALSYYSDEPRGNAGEEMKELVRRGGSAGCWARPHCILTHAMPTSPTLPTARRAGCPNGCGVSIILMSAMGRALKTDTC